METCMFVLISAATTLGLIALGVAWVILLPLPSPADGGGVVPPITPGCRL